MGPVRVVRNTEILEMSLSPALLSVFWSQVLRWYRKFLSEMYGHFAGVYMIVKNNSKGSDMEEDTDQVVKELREKIEREAELSIQYREEGDKLESEIEDLKEQCEILEKYMPRMKDISPQEDNNGQNTNVNCLPDTSSEDENGDKEDNLKPK